MGIRNNVRYKKKIKRADGGEITTDRIQEGHMGRHLERLCPRSSGTIPPLTFH